MNLNVLEIRNYLIRPNILEHFIDYFEEHLIFSQEATGMTVLGQFRPIGDPNRFVWMRGFADMSTRLENLKPFYVGADWEKYGPLANEMMLEWHDIHLLRPLNDMADFTYGLDTEGVHADLAAGTISWETGVIAIDFYEAQSSKRDELIRRFQTHIIPTYQSEKIQIRGSFVAEMTPNDFLRLPVIQNENEFVVSTAYENEEACQQTRAKLSAQINNATGEFLSKAPESLLLNPTLRSPLRYVKRP